MPERNPDFNHHGEAPDTHHLSALTLAHRAVAKFPELVKNYQQYNVDKWILPAAIIGLASLAINLEIRKGKKPEEILENITSDDIISAPKRLKEELKRAGKILNRFGHIH